MRYLIWKYNVIRYQNHFRLDAIACDAELQEKTESELTKVAQFLQTGVEQAMKEHEDKIKEDPSGEGNF